MKINFYYYKHKILSGEKITFKFRKAFCSQKKNLIGQEMSNFFVRTIEDINVPFNLQLQ